MGGIPKRIPSKEIGGHDRTFDQLTIMVRERRLMNIYVGNLVYETTEDDLRTAFENYGEVESAKIIIDRDTGRSKGFGFVEMPDNDNALAAIEGLDGKDMGGRTVKVNESRPKPQRDNRGGGGGYNNRY
jgi:cold-inducible RNA-binding protein